MAQEATLVKVKPAVRALRYAGGDVIRRVPVTVKTSFAFGDTGTINLFELPGNTLVTDIRVLPTTAFDASGSSAAATVTVTMPCATGTVTLYDAASTKLQLTTMTIGTVNDITPASGGLVIATYTAGTTTVGQANVYLSYIQYADEL